MVLAARIRAVQRLQEQFATDQEEREQLNEAHRLYGHACGELVVGMARVGRLDADAFERQQRQQLKRGEKSLPLPQFEGERTMFERETFEQFAARHSTPDKQPINYRGWLLFFDGAACLQQNELVRQEQDHPDAWKVRRDWHKAWAQRLRKEANSRTMMNSYQMVPNQDATNELERRIAAHERAARMVEAQQPESPQVTMARELQEIEARRFAAEVGPQHARMEREQAMSREQREVATMLGNPVGDPVNRY